MPQDRRMHALSADDNQLVIREVGEEDVALIARITRRVFSEPHHAQHSLLPPPSASRETEEEIREDLERGSRVLVLELHHPVHHSFHYPVHLPQLHSCQRQIARLPEPVAIARLKPNGPDTWLLGRFGVLPGHRGQGFGKTLLELIAAEAKKAGIRHLRLYCVAERLLIPYYQRRGFRMAEIRPHAERPLTVATMERDLPEDSREGGLPGAPSLRAVGPLLRAAGVTIPGPDPGFAAGPDPGPDPGPASSPDSNPDWQVLPSNGLYILWLHLPETKVIRAGRLGEHLFAQGLYAYIGSGFGNLPHRLRRHWTGPRRFHWHVDWLRARAVPVGMDILPWLPPDSSDEKPFVPGNAETSPALPSECELALALSKALGAESYIPRFGASDCGCAGHLFHVPETSPVYALPRAWEERLLCFYRRGF
ncbi:MAG: GNAT family N-acetyltransferase [Syntrophothermus sp.]